MKYIVILPLCQAHLKDGKLYQPVIRRKNYITNEFPHFNIVRAKRSITKMGLKMEQKECMSCSENEDKIQRYVKTNTDYISMMDNNGWKVRVFPRSLPMDDTTYEVEIPKHKVLLAELHLEEDTLALTTAQKMIKELGKK